MLEHPTCSKKMGLIICRIPRGSLAYFVLVSPFCSVFSRVTVDPLGFVHVFVYFSLGLPRVLRLLGVSPRDTHTTKLHGSMIGSMMLLKTMVLGLARATTSDTDRSGKNGMGPQHKSSA